MAYFQNALDTLLIFLGLLCLGAAIYTLFRQRRFVTAMPGSSVEIVVPAAWDEHFIATQFDRYQQQPALLSHYVSSLKTRFILTQEDKTAQVRSRFLKTKIEQLHLAKELQLALDDLQFLGLERDIRRLKLELDKETLQDNREARKQLNHLIRTRDELKVRLEVEQLQQQMNELGKKPEPKPTREQQRQQRREEIERDIERLKTEKIIAMNRCDSEPERRRVENMYDKRIRELQEELTRNL